MTIENKNNKKMTLNQVNQKADSKFSSLKDLFNNQMFPDKEKFVDLAFNEADELKNNLCGYFFSGSLTCADMEDAEEYVNQLTREYVNNFVGYEVAV